MYKNHNSKQKALFLPITQDIVQRIQNDTLSLCSPFWINRKQDEEVYVLMTTHFIVLCSKAGINYNYHYYTPLDFDLKFEVLGEDVSNPESEANSIVSKPTGFRLTRKDTATVDFHIIGANVLGVWLKYLTKTLNQIGFHKLFRPLRKLGKGGFATVYEVQRLTDHRFFAVKAFSKQNTLNSRNQIHKQNLLNQINFMRSIDSDHLIRLEGVFESDNSLYLVLEELSNGHLHDKINKRNGKFTSTEVKTLMVKMIRGIKELHDNNIMHRDIKPENIMMRDDLDPVIVDFGLAANVTWDDYLFYRCGTPGYVAPEVCTLEKGKKISAVCDIFSFGVIFHIFLTGRPLFSGRKFDEVYDNNKKMKFNLKAPEYGSIDPDAMDLLEKMLKINPSERITANEILMHPFLADQVMMAEELEEVEEVEEPNQGLTQAIRCNL